VIVNTAWLFRRLVRILQIDVVCDIGSMDGADALAFRDACPHGQVYAFEANPRNARSMLADPRFERRRIEIVPAAVCDTDGMANFYIVEPSTRATMWKGLSSLHRRAAAGYFETTVATVDTLTLDSFFAGRELAKRRVALWIDTEGKAFEVLAGARELCSDVRVIHVEVETTPCIDGAQRLYPQVKALLAEHGFIELATDRTKRKEQFNALFLRPSGRVNERLSIAGYLMLAWLRLRAIRIVSRVCPAYLRYRERIAAASFAS
jgi:2-O-methyltransferase